MVHTLLFYVKSFGLSTIDDISMCKEYNGVVVRVYVVNELVKVGDNVFVITDNTTGEIKNVLLYKGDEELEALDRDLHTLYDSDKKVHVHSTTIVDTLKTS